MSRIFFCPALLVAFVAVQAFGNDASDAALAGSLTYLEGLDFEILHAEGEASDIDPYDALGEEIFEGDSILTYDNTFIEIQLEYIDCVVKIAENSSFNVKSMTEKGGDFEVVYGRVRARVEKLLGQDIKVRGHNAVCAVRGTDFGIDVISSERSAEVLTKIYCFDGKVEVSIEGKIEPVVISSGEMLVIREDVVELRGIDPEISEYWRAHAFKTAAIQEKPTKVLTAEALERQQLLEAIDWDIRVSVSAGIMLAVAGTVCEILGFADIFAVQPQAADIINNSLKLSGTAFLVSSGFLFARAIEKSGEMKKLEQK